MKSNEVFSNYVQTEVPSVKIAIGKNVVRHFGETVYLNNEQEFQLELFNPTRKTVLAKIYLNERLISNSGVVLRPGERIWLDRYIDANAKFKFSTYEVENSLISKNAIVNNGKIKVEFYNELNLVSYITYEPVYSAFVPMDLFPAPFTFNSDNTTVNNTILNCGTTSTTLIETGRIEKGKNSNQNFCSYFGNFEFFAFYISNLQILPLSQKEFLTKKDLQKRCPNCNKKIKDSRDLFCSRCGTRI